MKTKSIKQTIIFYAKPDVIYQLLMDEKKHSAFSGSKSKISTSVNGKFNVFDGYCHGYNIELVRAKIIVQAWHFDEVGWPVDHYSICSFQFEMDGNKTILTFLQTEVPENKVGALKEVWNQLYWEPLKSYIKEHRKL